MCVCILTFTERKYTHGYSSHTKSNSKFQLIFSSFIVSVAASVLRHQRTVGGSVFFVNVLPRQSFSCWCQLRFAADVSQTSDGQTLSGCNDLTARWRDVTGHKTSDPFLMSHYETSQWDEMQVLTSCLCMCLCTCARVWLRPPGGRHSRAPTDGSSPK